MDAFRKTYGLTEQVDLLSGNSVQVFNRLTRKSQEEIRKALQSNPDQFADKEFLDFVNLELKGKYAYLIVRKGEDIFYSGMENGDSNLYSRLPSYGEFDSSFESGIYLDGETQHLIKQEDFEFSDGTKGSAFIVSGFSDIIPEVKSMVWEMVFAGIMILLLVGVALTGWVYKALYQPLSQLQKATHSP